MFPVDHGGVLDVDDMIEPHAVSLECPTEQIVLLTLTTPMCWLRAPQTLIDRYRKQGAEKVVHWHPSSIVACSRIARPHDDQHRQQLRARAQLDTSQALIFHEMRHRVCSRVCHELTRSFGQERLGPAGREQL